MKKVTMVKIMRYINKFVVALTIIQCQQSLCTLPINLPYIACYQSSSLGTAIYFVQKFHKKDLYTWGLGPFSFAMEPPVQRSSILTTRRPSCCITRDRDLIQCFHPCQGRGKGPHWQNGLSSNHQNKK